jgi:hypothetical protein
MNHFRALSSVLWGTLHQNRTLGVPFLLSFGGAKGRRAGVLQTMSVFDAVFEDDGPRTPGGDGTWI